MIHTFTALGQYLVADVNSGAVHVLDRMSYDLLSLLEKEETMGETCPREIRERLTQYSDQEVDETWEELRSLQEAGLLFSSDDYLDPEAAMELPKQAVVKALCLHVSHDCNLRCGIASRPPRLRHRPSHERTSRPPSRPSTGW